MRSVFILHGNFLALRGGAARDASLSFRRTVISRRAGLIRGVVSVVSGVLLSLIFLLLPTHPLLRLLRRLLAFNHIRRNEQLLLLILIGGLCEF